MTINQERFTTYKTLSPVLTTQTTCLMKNIFLILSVD